MKKGLLLFLLLSIFINSCNRDNKGSTAQPSKEITVWCWDPTFNGAAMDEAKKRYLAAYPDVKIDIIDMGKADLEQRLLTALASGQSSGLPDIVLIEDYNAYKFLASFPDSFLNLTGRIDHSNFVDYKTKLMTFDGDIYGVPFDTAATGWFYRRDIFSEAGFTHEDLQNRTWDEFIAIGEVIKEKVGVPMLLFNPTNPGELARTMMQSAGAWYSDESGTPSIVSNEALAEVLSIAKKIDAAGISVETGDWLEDMARRGSGKVASSVSGIWLTSGIKETTVGDGLWGVAPTPRLNVAGSKNASNSGGSSWYILSTAQNPDLAVDFMDKVWGSDVEFYHKIAFELGAIGSFMPAYDGGIFTEPSPFFGGQKYLVDFTSWIEDIPPISYGPDPYAGDDALGVVTSDFLRGRATIEETLAKAENIYDRQTRY